MAPQTAANQLGHVPGGFADYGFDTQMQPNEQEFGVQGSTGTGFKKEKVFPDDSSYEDVNRI